MVEVETSLRVGDCLQVVDDYADNFFDLIVTSPPYADSRAKNYGGVKSSEYVDWFLPRAAGFYRVLKDSGTFILNIKEKVNKGERDTYVLELILALRQQGWLWTEEFIWHKKNCFPGKWPNRFRDSWERCLQFNKSKKFTMYQESVMVPVGDWADKRLKTLGKNDTIRYDSQTNTPFSKNISNWVGRDKVYPGNVLHLATETGNKQHSATYPRALPEWFIALFSQAGDWILDPFVGSGTTCEVARGLGRHSVGIDLMPEYIELSKSNIHGLDNGAVGGW